MVCYNALQVDYIFDHVFKWISFYAHVLNDPYRSGPGLQIISFSCNETRYSPIVFNWIQDIF